MLGIFLDIETNGLDFFKHKPLEIAIEVVDLLNGQEIFSYHSLISQTYDTWKQSDINSLHVNDLTYDEIKTGKKPEFIKEEILGFFHRLNLNRKTSVFICQNPSFDRIFFSYLIEPTLQETLNWPYHWLDLASMHWAVCLNKEEKKIFPWEIGISKDQIATYLQLPEEKKPHRATNGVKHLLMCYEALLGFPFSSKKRINN